jgi:NitT/TauT family transport system substrate-binding protein
MSLGMVGRNASTTQRPRGTPRSACLRASVVLSLFASVFAFEAAHAADKVSFNMSWLPQGSVGGVLVGKAKNFFTEEGIDVDVTRGYGAQRTVNEIDQGAFDIGYADPVSIILNRTNGGETVLVGAINTRWPAGLCYIEKSDRPINGLSDLKDMTLAGNATSPIQRIVPAWLALNALPPKFVKMLQMDPAVYNGALLSGKIDLSECWEGSSRGLLTVLAARDGKAIGWLKYRDYGLDAYGSGFVTTEKMIKGRPDVLRRFLKASYRGYAHMAQHPDEAVALIMKQFPTLDEDVLKKQILETNLIITDSDIPDKPLGWIRDTRMTSTLNFVRSAFAVDEKIKLSDLYTDSFLQ